MTRSSRPTLASVGPARSTRCDRPGLLASVAVTVPGRGDLSPRHRRHHWGRWLGVVVIIAVLAAGGYAAARALHSNGGGSSPTAGHRPCPVGSWSPPAEAGAVHLVVLNATSRNGLAATVAGALRRRGFHVASVGNAPALMTAGVARVGYGTGRLPDAQAVGLQIARPTFVQDGRVAVVRLELGPGFRGLRSQAAVRAARARLVAARPTPAATC